MKRAALLLLVASGCESRFTFDYQIPDPPIPLQAVAGQRRVTLDWDIVPAASEYRVYYASEEGVTPANLPVRADFAVVADARPGLVVGLDPGKTWHFVVAAASPKGESDPTPEISAIPIGTTAGGLGFSTSPLRQLEGILDGGAVDSASGFGTSVAFAGDLNADGLGDLIVGAPFFVADDAGRIVLRLGSSGGISPTESVTVDGPSAASLFGYSLAAGVDANNDSIPDVLVGAQGGDYAALHAGGGAALLAPTPFWFASGTVSSQFGRSVAFAGDVDGDGFQDILVGAPFEDGIGADSGVVRLYRGTATGVDSTSSWSAPSEQVGSQFAAAVAGVGDVNDDGYDDVAVGAPGWDDVGIPDAGKVYVYFGGPTGLSLAAAWDVKGTQSGSGLGRTIAPAGNVDGDGYDDFVAGQPDYDVATFAEGRVIGVRGGPLPSADWSVAGAVDSGRLGFDVAGGDVNGNGYGDLLAGEPGFGPNARGRASLHLGGPSGFAAVADWTWVADVDYASAGDAVALGADVNGNGIADGAVGAPSYDTAVDAAGVLAVFAGPPVGGPSVRVGDPLSGGSGSVVNLRGVVFSVSAAEVGVSCTVTWGDGTFTSLSSCSPEKVEAAGHAYATTGTFPVVLRVLDGFGSYGESGTFAYIR